ncbi:hypothetical protein ccbrp13_11730 [Ktedonobacteria bacterium brp13]|nr:hypothetical protein ccbrp13_11730 [Ktedonobacteria bacterium brp13]
MRTLLLTDRLITDGSGVINALYIFFVTQNLHMNASLYGIFCAILTLDGVVGSWTIKTRSPLS